VAWIGHVVECQESGLGRHPSKDRVRGRQVGIVIIGASRPIRPAVLAASRQESRKCLPRLLSERYRRQVRQSMQIIIPYPGSPEEYVRDCGHLGVACPETCPNCLEASCLRKHGFYERSVSAGDHPKLIPVLIRIRRFICRLCRLTASMLPDFAQPHRLVGTDAVDRFLSGERTSGVVMVWAHLLQPYLDRFEKMLPATKRVLSAAYGFELRDEEPADLWRRICRRFGGARRFTARFAREVGMTVFGAYRCHRVAGKSAKNRGNEFPNGREPPNVRIPHGDAP